MFDFAIGIVMPFDNKVRRSCNGILVNVASNIALIGCESISASCQGKQTPKPYHRPMPQFEFSSPW